MIFCEFVCYLVFGCSLGAFRSSLTTIRPKTWAIRDLVTSPTASGMRVLCRFECQISKVVIKRLQRNGWLQRDLAPFCVIMPIEMPLEWLAAHVESIEIGLL